MKVFLSGKDFTKPSLDAKKWARMFELYSEGQVEVDYREISKSEDAEYPVLVIPEKTEFRLVKNILYATNFYSADTSVIRHLAHLARTFDASIHCVHIDTTEEYSALTNVLADHFGTIAADLEVSFTNVCSDSVIEGLEAFINNNKVDLVVMLQHKHEIPVDSKHNLISVMAHESELPLLLFSEKVFQD